MTVGELKTALKGYKNTDQIFLVKDWEICNEQGELTELRELKDVTSQRIIVDLGIDFEDRQQVLLEFEED